MDEWDDGPVSSSTSSAGTGNSVANLFKGRVLGIGRGKVESFDNGDSNRPKRGGFGGGGGNRDWKSNDGEDESEQSNGFGGRSRQSNGFGGGSRGGFGGDRQSNGFGGGSRGGFGGDRQSNGFGGGSRGGFGGDRQSNGFGGGGGGREKRGGDWTCPDSGDDSGESNSFGGGSGRGFGGSRGGGFGGRGGGRGGRGGGGGGFGDKPKRDGDWNCPDSDCGAHNFASRTECFKCRTPKPAGAGGDAGSGGFSRSGFGGFGGGGRGRSGFGGGNDSNEDDSGESSSRPRNGFGGIGSRGGRGGSTGGFGGNSGSGGDEEKWICADEDCGADNFPSRRVCFKCKKPKPGGDGDDKPREAPYIPPDTSSNEDELFNSGTQKGINFDKYDEIQVEVSGQNPASHIESFEQAKLYPTFLQNIKRAKYTKPTPIQKYAIPCVLAGRDIMACAQTGSGKTAAFVLPVMTALVTDGVVSDQYQEVQLPQAICVAPTRELALQIYQECRKFSCQTEIRTVVLYGGTSVGHQLRQVENGANFVVGTPGRLLDVINRGKISLSHVKFLILDEADRMLDMGFEPEIRKLVETMGMPSKQQRQTLMFSATFPVEIQKLAGDFLNNYLFITVGRVGGANTDVEQNFFEVDRREKRECLIDILRQGGNERTLVFVEQKRNADFLATHLCQNEFPTTSIHGDRMQREREEALRDFKSGKAYILVATSVAARGLDIPDVRHVVNYDLPSSIDEYVHRIGRTGRCGNLGKATSFFLADQDQPLAANLVRILKEAQQTVPDWLQEHARGMGAGDAGSYGGKFGGKDFRGTKHDEGESKQDSQWSGGQGAGAADDDEDWD